jgi:NAD(P)-dependent dehydrogenase (short-subunit alcohol dehydrogenase family)
MKPVFDIKDKVIIVTGGYGHIGSGVVNGLLDLGAKVIVAARSREKFELSFPKPSTNLYFEPFDISKSGNYFIKRFKDLVQTYGTIDVVINNAHYSKGKSPYSMSDEDFAYTLTGVLGSVQKSIQGIIPVFKEQGGGKLINISSMYGHISPNFEKLYSGKNCEQYTNPPHYGAGKAGVIQLTKYYAALLGKEGIYVNAISPGPFSKQNIQDESPEFIDRLKSSNPLNRLGKPEDMVGIIALLSSSASDFITGQNICVDGGWTIW